MSTDTEKMLAEALRILLDYRAEHAGEHWLEITCGEADYEAAKAALAAYDAQRAAPKADAGEAGNV